MKIMEGKRTMQTKVALSILALTMFLAFSDHCALASSSGLTEEGAHNEYVGFFNGITRDTISLMDQKSHKVSTYRLSPDVIVLRNDEPFDINMIPIHSIVSLIVVNRLVEQIIVMEVSS